MCIRDRLREEFIRSELLTQKCNGRSSDFCLRLPAFSPTRQWLMKMAIWHAVTAARTVPVSHRSSLFTRLSMEILVTIYTLETFGMNYNFMRAVIV